MEELYGPLLGLQRQQQVAYEVVKQLVPTKENGHPDIGNFNAQERAAWDFVAERYLMPFQRKMSDLLWDKVYLLESSELPGSFEDFVANASQFECLHRLAMRHWLDRA